MELKLKRCTFREVPNATIFQFCSTGSVAIKIITHEQAHKYLLLNGVAKNFGNTLADREVVLLTNTQKLASAFSKVIVCEQLS